MQKKTKNILFIVNPIDFFLSHRLHIALSAKKSGYNVHVATEKGEGIEKIEAFGFVHHKIPFARGSSNPFKELKTVFYLYLLFYSLKPDLIHLITIKPIIYGGIIAHITNVKAIVIAITGLGTVFLSNSLIGRLRCFFVIYLYRFALKHKNQKVIFQNIDDRNLFLKYKIAKFSQVSIIRGSGVVIGDYPYVQEPSGIPVVIMASRLIKDKGVFEFINAAKILNKRKLKVEMRLIGCPDFGNKTSITKFDFENLKNSKCVKVLGFSHNVAREYAKANIVCLPSYREGLPKSLIEAAACGRAIVTTNVPGCRDAILSGKSGILVPAKNSVALADAIEKLIKDKPLRNKMGQKGRELAIKAFPIEKIVKKHLVIYNQLLNKFK